VEIRLLSDPVYGEEFDVVVSELTDQYVAGEVQGAERDQMERYFFAAPARREKLRIAAALKERQLAGRGKRWLPSRELRIAASILIIAGLTFGIWWAAKTGGESELDKGRAALQTAYQGQRPVEPRVSELPYSRYQSTRGTAADEQRQDNLRRAELHLAEAVRQKPTSEARHSLGKVYLAQGKFDEAIRELEQSLSGSKKPAQVYNDLGVAWLEKREFNRSLDSFNKALQLDSNLLDALFNRAICYQKQSRLEEAKADWTEYLKRDPTSPWADEARQRLNSISANL
jgi:tetratricopeptide (TPR) repeat protein